MGDLKVDLAQTFVQLADTLVDGFDMIELLTTLATRSVDLLGADAAGILLAGGDGLLHVVAASSERVRLLELFQIQNEEGPCHVCFREGVAVVGPVDDPRWPRFAAEAGEAGYASVQAIPMRLRHRTIGALNVFSEHPVPTDSDALLVARAMADTATIAILQDAAMREAQLVAQQLQTALNSRIAVEQAKGVIAERHGVDMDAAFALLRAHARDNNLGLSDVAADVVSGSLRI